MKEKDFFIRLTKKKISNVQLDCKYNILYCLCQKHEKFASPTEDLSQTGRNLASPMGDLSQTGRNLASPTRVLSQTGRNLASPTGDLSHTSRNLYSALPPLAACMDTGDILLRWTSIPSRGRSNTPNFFVLQKPG